MISSLWLRRWLRWYETKNSSLKTQNSRFIYNIQYNIQFSKNRYYEEVSFSNTKRNEINTRKIISRIIKRRLYDRFGLSIAPKTIGWGINYFLLVKFPRLLAEKKPTFDDDLRTSTVWPLHSLVTSMACVHVNENKAAGVRNTVVPRWGDHLVTYRFRDWKWDVKGC